MPLSPHLVFVPGRELTVAGVGGLLSVQEHLLTIKLGRRVLTVEGSGLAVAALGEGSCTVTGRIRSLSVTDIPRKGEPV